jgi:ElaB/YqjD/DUF883 family membrane-anchored ribosome-binding protein
MTTSAELQREAEATRAGLSTTLDELRLSVTRDAITGGASALARESGAAVGRALVRRASDNPLAALLIGAGVAMLFSGRMSGWSLNLRSTASNGQVSGEARHAVSDTVGQATESARHAAAAASGSVSDAIDRAGNAITEGREKAAQAIDRMQERASQASDRANSFVQEQPVVVAALAVAAGAALGALLPVTETERRYLGPAAARAAERGREVADHVAEAAVPKAADAASEVLSREVLGRETRPAGTPS